MDLCLCPCESKGWCPFPSGLRFWFTGGEGVGMKVRFPTCLFLPLITSCCLHACMLLRESFPSLLSNPQSFSSKAGREAFVNTCKLSLCLGPPSHYTVICLSILAFKNSLKFIWFLSFRLVWCPLLSSRHCQIWTVHMSHSPLEGLVACEKWISWLPSDHSLMMGSWKVLPL